MNSLFQRKMRGQFLLMLLRMLELVIQRTLLINWDLLVHVEITISTHLISMLLRRRPFTIKELNNYFTMSASTSVIVDKSSDGEFLHIDFNFSFPALSCEFAAVDVSDILGTVSFNDSFHCNLLLLEE
ncbi:hypothetical protein CsSME_00007761 [Camellia sinensis var. sinensis]